MSKKLAIAMFGQKRLSREGGVEIVVKELCTRMAQNGCDVTCYNRAGHHVSGAEYDDAGKTEYEGIRQKSVPTIERRGLAAVSSSFFAALCSAFGKYDVVHADVFLLPSRWEGLPISLLESMYMKKVCVVSNVIGNRDVIHNGENGFVCTKAEDFVKAIEACRGENEKLTEQAYRDILEMYNTKVMAEQYGKKYEMAINKRGGVQYDLIQRIAVVRPYTLTYSVSVEPDNYATAKAVA